MKKTESFYQEFLEQHLGGKHCRCKYGETDVTTDTIHAEIKVWDNWKGACGQLLIYNKVEPRQDLRLYVYGNKAKTIDETDIAGMLYNEFGIELFMISYDNEIVSIRDVRNASIESIVYIPPDTSPSVVATMELTEDIKQKIDQLADASGFSIDLVVVCNILYVSKREVVRTLTSSYIKDTDYIVTKGDRPDMQGRRGVNNNKKWLITSECFKRLVMRSGSSRSELVRNYLISRNVV